MVNSPIFYGAIMTLGYKVVNSPILYAALMILWLVALPAFQIISSVSGIVNVISVVVPATACLLILYSLGAIIIAQCTK